MNMVGYFWSPTMRGAFNFDLKSERADYNDMETPFLFFGSKLERAAVAQHIIWFGFIS